jgi:hypothetical protein
VIPDCAMANYQGFTSQYIPSIPEDQLGYDGPPPANPEMWLYRERTIALLRRYLRISIEVGRLPSLLGRELFRSKVTVRRRLTD